jgi:hypothetical protein
MSWLNTREVSFIHPLAHRHAQKIQIKRKSLYVTQVIPLDCPVKFHISDDKLPLKYVTGMTALFALFRLKSLDSLRLHATDELVKHCVISTE